MRVPLPSISAAARATSFLAVAAIGIVALLHAERHEAAPAPTNTIGANAADSIAAELLRCQNTGLAAQDDRSCLAIWAENRRRFFGDKHQVIAGAPSADSKPSQQTDR